MHYQEERNFGCRVSDSWMYRGLKTVVMENELIRIVILADKGADIYQFVYKKTDTDFLWRSPWGVRDPSTFIPTTGDGVGMWMDTYEGGWQTVLPGGGFPSVYGEADMGLHAEVNTLPWDCTIMEDSVERVSVRFSVRTYRTPFFFEKTLTIEKSKPALFIKQTLINEGAEAVHCIWGEHIALGSPFLSDKCLIDLPGGKIINHPEEFHVNNKLAPGALTEWPMTRLKDGTAHNLSIVPGQDFFSYDQSYITDMPDSWYGITNRELGVGFGVAFSEIYKYLWYWQSLGGGTGYPWYGRTYNIGLEPFTSYTNEGLGTAVDNGTALLVKAGQKLQSSVTAVAYESLTGIEGVSQCGAIKLKK